MEGDMRTLSAVVTAAVLLTLSVSVMAEETGSAQRAPAATEDLFTPEYLDQVNTERQAQDIEEQKARVRHQRAVDAFARPR
jgi:hypothetical protein